MTHRVKIAIVVPLAVFAVLALLVGVGLIAGGGGASSLDDTVASSEAARGTAPEQPVPAPDLGSGEGAAAEAGAAKEGGYAAAVPPASAAAEHYLIRSGDLSLLVARGRLLPTVERIRALTVALNGYVMSSSIGSRDGEPEPIPLDDAVLSSEGGVKDAGNAQGSDSAVIGDSAPYAHLVIRVPDHLFDDAVKRLSKLGTVRNASTYSEDVTSQYVDLEARLRHHRAVESRLVRFLDETTTVNQMLAVQDRIDRVQLTIEELTAQLKALRETTTYGTLSVFVSERDRTPAAIHTSDTFGGTFWNSVDLLGRGIRVTALALTALVPFLVVLGGATTLPWLLIRRVRRSRRRAAPPVQTA